MHWNLRETRRAGAAIAPVTAALIALALGAAACSDDGTSARDGRPAGDAGPPVVDAAPLEPAPFPAAFVVITSPTGRPSFTTDQLELTVAGVAAGELSALSYSITDGAGAVQSADVALAERWQIGVQLAPGDNIVQVQATTTEGTLEEDSITVTVNPELPMGRPSAAPDAVIRGAGTPVTFSVRIDDTANLVGGSLKVVVVDPAGQPTGVDVATLADDGQGGDELAGDGLFGASATVDESADQVLRLRVAAETAAASGPRTAYSETFTVAVISPLTDAEVDALEATSTLAAESYGTYLETMDSAAAAAKVVTDLLARSDVAEAGVSPTGFTIWWEMDSGLPAAYSFYPAETKGSCSDPVTPPLIPRSNAILLEPYHAEWGPNSDMDATEPRLEQAICPFYEPIVKRPGPAATLDEFRAMDNYGVILVSSHGAVWNNKVLFATEVEVERAHVKNPASQYLADFRARPRRLVWIASGRGATYVRHWALTPGFVSHYNTDFSANAVIHASTCSGAHNATMAAAFLAGGAGVYSGFTDTVSTTYAVGINKPYFRSLVEGKTVKEAWEQARREAGNRDPTRSSTQFVYTPSGAGDIGLITRCDGYTRIRDNRNHVYSASNSEEISETAYFSSDKLVPSPFDPTGRTFMLQAVHKSCRFKFEKSSTLPGGGLTRTETGAGELTETYMTQPENPFAIDPDATYAVTKLTIDRQAGTVKLYPTPTEACVNHEDWVLRTTTKYSLSTPQTYTDVGGCSFYGGMAAIPGFSNSSDYILITPPNVEITEEYVKGELPIDNDKGTATIQFYYELAPAQ